MDDIDSILAKHGGGDDIDAILSKHSASPAEKPSFLHEAGTRAVDYLKSFANPIHARDVGQSFVDLGRGVLNASDFVGRAVAHPIDTFGGGKAGAVGRQVMRGVNSNIPLANLAVEHMGGPAEHSAQDQEKAPGAEEFGSLVGAPVQGMVGQVAGKAIAAPFKAVGNKLMEGAEARATKDIAKDIVSAEGPKARVTDQQRIAQVKGRVFDMTAENPELREVWRMPAEQALPKLAEIKRRVAAPIEPAYQAVDAKTGGMRLGDILDSLNKQADELSKTPSTLPDADRLRHVAKQFERAWGEPGFNANAVISPDGMTAGAAVDMLTKVAQKNPGKAAALGAEIARIKELAKGGINLDKRIPTQDFRAEVTHLGKTADTAMGGLEGTARHEALAKLYEAGKRTIDEHLDRSGVPPEMLDQLRDANDKYFLLSRAESAIESRGWKESNRKTGAAALLAAVKNPHTALHATLPIAVSAAVANPHAIPEMVGAYALGHAVPAIAERADWKLAQMARAKRMGIEGAKPGRRAPVLSQRLINAAKDQRERDSQAASQLGGR